MGKLIVSLSPHAHGSDTVEKNMYGVIIALLPALLVSFYFFGIGSAIVSSVGVAMMSFSRSFSHDASIVLTATMPKAQNSLSSVQVPSIWQD